MKILDTEYQFDRNKLTITYIADNRVDFREMVRDLYSKFKTRIWMKQIFLDTPRRGGNNRSTNTNKTVLYNHDQNLSGIIPRPQEHDRMNINIPRDYSNPMFYLENNAPYQTLYSTF